MPDKSFDIQVSITDNSPEVLAAVGTAIQRALWAVGVKAEEFAKQNAPVDTGRLRNSITHQEGKSETVIGSNVEYAAAQELGTSRGIRPKHYLQNAVSNHSGEFRDIIKNSMQNV